MSFECSWPGGFHDLITTLVNILTFSMKHINIGLRCLTRIHSLQEIWVPV